jgi:flagellar protein FliJ
MKKFKFKLDGLLKVREFREKKLKLELGEIMKEINSLKELNKELNNAISEAYRGQEQLLADSTGAKMLEFFPFFIEAKKEHIKNNENLIYSLQRKYEQKVHELTVAMGEVKVIDNLKDKEQTEYKKEADKKYQQDIEDLLHMKRHADEE